jgi:hypothetical protein
MKKTLLALCMIFFLACSNNKTDQKDGETQKTPESEQGKLNDQEKKDGIIAQIKKNEGLVISVSHDSIGTGGINNGFVTIKNTLQEINFDIVNVQVNIYLANGNIHQSTPYTFTDLKAGETKTRNIPGTGNKGTKVEVVLMELQSKWLTNGHLLRL